MHVRIFQIFNSSKIEHLMHVQEFYNVAYTPKTDVFNFSIYTHILE